MNINLMDHRQARRQARKAITVRRCAVAFILGLLIALPPVWLVKSEQIDWTHALAAAQAESNRLQLQQAQWEAKTQAWPQWAAQRQAWLTVAHDSQMPLRLWHWLNTGAVHGLRWTQWQQEGLRWSVMGEAQSLLLVRDWVAGGEYRPVPADREVSVTQSEHSEDGLIGFVLSWEELP